MIAPVIKQLIERMSESVEKQFSDVGRVHQMCFVSAANNPNSFMLDLDELGDDLFSKALLKGALAYLKATRYLVIRESWMAGTKTDAETQRLLDWQKEHGNIDGYPDKFEAVIFVGEDSEFGAIQAQRRIERPANGKPYLGPLEFIQSDVTIGCPTGMLPGRERTLH